MVQKKTQKKSNKTPMTHKAIQPVKPNPLPVVTTSPQSRSVNDPVLACILSIVVAVVYFFVGNLFMQMAVRENFCQIRYTEKPKQMGEVVAVIDGEKIYMSEIREYAKSIPQLSELPLEMIYPQLLDTVVNSRVLQRAAEKAGVESLAAVQRSLQTAHDQIVAQAYLDRRLKAMQSDNRLQRVYEEEMKSFKPVEEVHARHILVKTEDEAKNILVQLKAGASFGMLAGKYSLDKSSPDGDLGYFTEDMMIPEFGKAVFALKVDQLSAPIKTPFGWHVVLLEDRRQTTPPTFDEVKSDLRKILMEQDMKTVLEDERKIQNVIIKKPKL